MRRTVVPELLDDDRGTAQEIADSLSDLRMLNRWLGGVATTVTLLRRVADARGLKRLTFLDVAGASGDISAEASRILAQEGIALETAVLDRAPSHLRTGFASVCASAFRLPFQDAAFDVVGSSLFIHHLQPEEITSFIREAIRCARRAVIINDLRRTRVHWWSALLGRMIYRSQLTRHDAPVSVHRSYTVPELREILAAAGFPEAEFTRHFFFRMGVVIWRKVED
jgi:ubiquinone/menaquinone biosynthesis C-methylase UbiE